MRIWFDILTPKQVMYFNNAVVKLKEDGHDVLCTSREYREAIELARIKGLNLKIVGKHGGPEKYGKLIASAERVRALADVVKGFSPDTAITFSSPEGARVAFGLGIRHIGLNDSPHAEAVAKLTIPLMNRLLCPWVIPYSSWTIFGIARDSISRYHALDPAAWLKQDKKIDKEANITTSATVVNERKFEDDHAQVNDDEGGGEAEMKNSHDSHSGQAKTVRKSVLIRLEESKASYIADKKLASTELVDRVIEELANIADISVLCRYNDQIEQAKERYGAKAKIIESVVDGVPLIKSADLFIGAGGTMSAEAALLGIPTISIAPLRYHVEEYLSRSGLLAKALKPTTIVRLANKMLGNEKYRIMLQKKAARVLNSMEDPTKRIIEEALSTEGS